MSRSFLLVRLLLLAGCSTGDGPPARREGSLSELVAHAVARDATLFAACCE